MLIAQSSGGDAFYPQSDFESKGTVISPELSDVSPNHDTSPEFYRDISIPPDYLTDFETWPPADWIMTGGNHSFVPYTDANGNNWAEASFWSQVSGTSIMTSPPLHVEDGDAQLRFTWSHAYYYIYPNDAVSIRVSHNYTNWYQFWSRTGSAFDSNDGASSNTPGSGVTETISIPTAYTDSTFWIRFVATSGNGRDLFLDNVIVRATPTAPILIYAPDSISFGIREQNVLAGPLNLIVTNDGSDTLFIDAGDISILGTNADQFSFSAANLPAALMYGQSVTIPVFMTPTSDGVKTATLRIVNNQSRTEYDIPLTGEGADGVVNMNNGSITLAAGEVYGFYDSGGPAASYSAYENYIYTFYPPAGELIRADFLSFNVENGYDFLYIYEGSSAEGLLVETLTGSGIPEQIISAAGALTFRFSSDDSMQYPGWMIRISSVPAPPLPPDVVVLLNPPDEANGLPVEGFNLTWTPSAAGGLPASYDVFLSDNPADIGQFVWNTAETFLNPSTAENPLAFDYNLVYYWTVQAFNDYGFSEPAAIRSFRIELPPPVIEVFPASLAQTLTHPDSLASSQTLTISNPGGRPLNYRFGMSETLTRAAANNSMTNAIPVISDGNAAQQAELASVPGSVTAAGNRAVFDLQFNYPTFLNDGEYGIATDGEYFYTTDWSSNLGGLDVAKYNLDGSFVQEFTITGAVSVRDLAYDGQYFYGAAAANTIYKMDFTAGTVIGTFMAPVSVRAITYDSAADAFWVGNNWNADLRLIDRTGMQLRALNTAVGNFAGLAYDNITGLAPTLWGFTQNNPSASTWVQLDLSTGAVLQAYDMANSAVNLGGSSAGGCQIVRGLVPGTATLLGNIQNMSIFGLELCPDFYWVTPQPSSGTLESGESAVIDISFDASDLDIDTYSGLLKIYNNSETGQLDVPVNLTVDGIFPAVFAILPEVSYSFGNVEELNPAARIFTITNSGGSVPAPLIINAAGIYLTNDADSSFVIMAEGLPVSLRHNESYQFSVLFTPQSPGPKSAVLNIQDNLDRTIHTITLTGEGVTETIGSIVNLTASVVARENVLLSWGLASRFSDDLDEESLSRSGRESKAMGQRDSEPEGGYQRVLRGYNIYRNGSGPINPALLTDTSYLDEGLTTGTYSYAVQGVYYSAVTAMSDSVTVWVDTDPPTLPFTENWASSSFSTNGWTPGSTNWFIRTIFGNPAPSAAFSYTPHVTNYDIPLTSISFDSAELPAIKLKFDLNLSNLSTATAENLSWEVWDGEVWTTLGTVSNAAGNIPWTTFESDISDYAVGNDFQIRFRAHGADNDNINYWHIDNIILKLMVYNLDAPELSINLLTGMAALSWEPVPNAELYRVYASDDIYVADPWTPLATTADTTYTFSGTELRKFFRVTAIAD